LQDALNCTGKEEMKNLLKLIQYDLLDFIEGEEDAHYSSHDVTSCIKLLLDFLTTIDTQALNICSAKAHIRELNLSLSELNDKCNGALIDIAQREDIDEFIQRALVSANIEIEGDITEQWRTW
jgi:hypothetical protein